MNFLNTFLWSLWSICSCFGYIQGAHVLDRSNTRVVAPRLLPDYVERGYDSYSGERCLLIYPDLHSLTREVDSSSYLLQGPVRVKFNFSKWISTSGVSCSYQLPQENTVQLVVNPAVDRWLKVKSMSQSALDAYCIWMEQKTQNIVLDIAEYQKQLVLTAYAKRVQSCLDELQQHKKDLKTELCQTKKMQDDTCRTIQNLVVGVSAVAVGTTALASYCEYSKLSYIVGGLYASYLWWQYYEHAEQMKWWGADQARLNRELEQSNAVSDQLVNNLQPQEHIKDLFDMHYRHSMQCFQDKIACYRLQEERKLVVWQQGQERFIGAEVEHRQSIEEDEFVVRQKKIEEFTGQQRLLRLLMQQRPLSLPTEQVMQQVVSAPVENHASTESEKRAAGWVGSVWNRLKRVIQ